MAEKKLGIIELLNRVGEENVRVQFLDACMTGTDYARRKGTTVTFGTNAIHPQEMLGEGQTKLYGIVVWIPRADKDRILAEFK